MKEYSNLIEILEKHLCPKKNILVAQHRFLLTYQSENQSLAEYITLLRQDIGDCDFISPCNCKISISDIFLRAQFIRGIRDNTIREQLLQSSVSTFAEITGKALALEASKIDSHELSKNQPSPNTTNHAEDVKKVAKYRKSRRENLTPSQKFNAKSPGRHKNYRSRSKSKIDYRQLGIEGLCLRCGNNNHIAKDCRTNKSALKCTACDKTGHLFKVCIRSLLNNNNNETNTANMKSTNYIQEETSDYGINHIIDIYENQGSEHDKSKKYFTTG
ncbi:hypothetical protein ALC62_04079 [Cyphomyrmex costatus]|uniref:CCHC-type domain-containing protein n=1 Tax=Cyphomyrmex costatus TaxID=456900 RepID=A0A151IKM6_9HYME|nr:hypothetical protein ALC62_04079 [Cyphomyrmex costatus]